MNKLDGRILRGLLLLMLLAATVPLQVEGRLRRHPRRVSATTAAARPPGPQFQLDCTLPTLTSGPLAIDKSCGNTGNAAAGSPGAKQNEVKNRFCLAGAPTTPVDVNFSTFDTLQREAEKRNIPFGRKTLPNSTKTVENLPPDRSVLVNLLTDSRGRQLGEGTLVTLEGFVFKAQHSNTFVFSGNKKGGESVNCNGNSLAGNDIHIALASTASETVECRTVTAEINPHHRNAIYNRFDTNPKDFLNGAKQKPGQDKLKGSPLPLEGARVRVTGQLFFDASHSPCHGDQGGAPQRRSIWEVHPVFAIEVFDTAQNKFVPFEEFARNH